MRAPSIRLGSRAQRAGEAAPGFPLGRAVLAAAGAVVLTLIACAPGARASEAKTDKGDKTEAAPTRRTPSGLPVPRYASLKFGEVNARAGPGDDFQLKWTYRVRGLPVQVIAETDEWRRVCDPDGEVAWIHQRTLDNNHRTVMRTRADALALRSKPDAGGRPVADLAGRSLAALDNCKDGWCRLAAGRTRGWVPENEVWGVADGPQCRPRPPIRRVAR